MSEELEIAHARNLINALHLFKSEYEAARWWEFSKRRKAAEDLSARVQASKTIFDKITSIRDGMNP